MRTPTVQCRLCMSKSSRRSSATNASNDALLAQLEDRTSEKRPKRQSRSTGRQFRQASKESIDLEPMFATAEDNPSSAHYNIGCKPDDEDTVADVDHPENKHERSRTLAHIREIEKFQNVAVLPDCASLPVWNFADEPLRCSALVFDGSLIMSPPEVKLAVPPYEIRKTFIEGLRDEPTPAVLPMDLAAGDGIDGDKDNLSSSDRAWNDYLLMTNDDLVGEITQDYPKASFDQQFWKWAPTILKPATVRRTRQRVDDDNDFEDVPMLASAQALALKFGRMLLERARRRLRLRHRRTGSNVDRVSRELLNSSTAAKVTTDTTRAPRPRPTPEDVSVTAPEQSRTPMASAPASAPAEIVDISPTVKLPTLSWPAWKPAGEGRSPAVQPQLVAEELPTPEARVDRLCGILQASDEDRQLLSKTYLGTSVRPDLLNVILRQWEECAIWIAMREDLLVELALFETVGSDPWRLFLGTSDVRLREMSTRASLQSLLRIATRAVLQALEHVKGPVRFAGQDYREKMRTDEGNVSRELCRHPSTPDVEMATAQLISRAKALSYWATPGRVDGRSRKEQVVDLLTHLPAPVNPYLAPIRSQNRIRPIPQSLQTPQTARIVVEPVSTEPNDLMDDDMSQRRTQSLPAFITACSLETGLPVITSIPTT
ncbi:unnamed protein product (mitochondrion) [Plasmodiophora brassicae]|uniref:Uncharacterized protein n=1 Tax=Plasmodiophora brassicae TaxID=37360 RepID=A0A3P3XYF6_PLABS|nr:unnamed protein product [Plasmodiophora brassicae]